MSIREFILGKFHAFGLTEAQMLELGVGGLDLDADYDVTTADSVGRAMCGLVAEMVLFPYQDSINESGFSVHWNFQNLGKYYKYLCNRYKVTPNADVLSLLGISTIIDRTNKW